MLICNGNVFVNDWRWEISIWLLVVWFDIDFDSHFRRTRALFTRWRIVSLNFIKVITSVTWTEIIRRFNFVYNIFNVFFFNRKRINYVLSFYLYISQNYRTHPNYQENCFSSDLFDLVEQVSFLKFCYHSECWVN